MIVASARVADHAHHSVRVASMSSRLYSQTRLSPERLANWIKLDRKLNMSDKAKGASDAPKN